MTSNPSSAERLAISPVIVRENIRRFWPMGLMSLLIYFAMGPVPMLMRPTVPDSTYSLSILSDFITYSLVGTIFAVVSAVMMFRYMHSSSALSMLHALPLTRRTLFLSNFLSGLLLLLTPFVVNALIVLSIGVARNYVAASGIWWLIWFAAVCVTMLFTYAVSVFAGMVSGNTPVHLLTAVAFNFAWLIIYVLGVLQATTFLFGMSADNETMNGGAYLHPLSYFMAAISSVDTDGTVIFSLPSEVFPLQLGMPVYLLIAVAVSIAAYFLYRRFRAERAGRSITSRPVEYVFVFIIVAAGMFTGGILIGQIDPANHYGVQMAGGMNYVSAYYIVGALIGAVVSFIVATMILRKGARIFGFFALRHFGIFAAAATVFMVCTMTNITGFETRVPSPSEVSTGAFHSDGYLMPPYRYGIRGVYGESADIPVTDEDGIEALTDLHRRAIADEDYANNFEADKMGRVYTEELLSAYVGLAYALESGGREARSYVLYRKYLRDSDEFARLLSSDSVKEYLSIESMLGYEALNVSEIYYEREDGDGFVGLDTEVRSKLRGEALKKLAVCLDEDYRAMDANDMMRPGDELFTLSLSSGRAAGVLYGSGYAALSGEGESIYGLLKGGGEKNYSLMYTVTEKSVKTVAYLKELGVYDSIVKTADEFGNHFLY